MRMLMLCAAFSCLLTGCVTQRYVGVQITSTAPMSVTSVVVNGREVVMCRIQEGNSNIPPAN
ncbi:hypothetical protein DEO48_25220 [Enterobacter sp. CGMCC 5087]|nr:hypothetical protein DEO48_25220 [Enterobacter sp. CGMCC 5087]